MTSQRLDCQRQSNRTAYTCYNCSIAYCMAFCRHLRHTENGFYGSIICSLFRSAGSNHFFLDAFNNFIGIISGFKVPGSNDYNLYSNVTLDRVSTGLYHDAFPLKFIRLEEERKVRKRITIPGQISLAARTQHCKRVIGIYFRLHAGSCI